MPEPWYECVPADTPLLQGDFILDCPLLGWKHESPNIVGHGEDEVLSEGFDVIKQDVVVMTQACDLEQKKVDEIVVCTCFTISEIRIAWEQDLRSKAQNPSEKAWRRFCESIHDGFQWNHAMLNRGDVGGVKTEVRVVDFHEIYTLPLKFASAVAQGRGQRLRLRPPYREHLSQAFARYFMRVGLPSPVDAAW